MAFYDEIGKKLSRTGQEAVQKTKNFTEITKLNSEISEIERGINRAYTEIGKIYYQKYAVTSTDNDMLLYLQQIVDSLQKMEEIQEKIRIIKGIGKCKNCGADVDTNAIFCNHCGARQIPEVKIPENGEKCPACGQRIEKGQMFCTQCGRKVDIGKREAEKKCCAVCGSELEPEVQFCVNCGTKVVECVEEINEQ